MNNINRKNKKRCIINLVEFTQFIEFFAKLMGAFFALKKTWLSSFLEKLHCPLIDK
jgi:hypothetical protein